MSKQKNNNIFITQNVNKKVPLQPQQHQQPGQLNLQRQGQSNLQHHQEQDSPLFGKPLPCQNRGRRLSEPTPTQENIPFLVGMMPPSSPDPLGFKPIRIKLPDHMKKENSGGSADSYPESNQQVLYGQSMPHSYDRYETTSHSSHNRDYPTSHRWEDKSQIFNYERSQSWDDTSNSNYQAKHTDKEPRQPIISRHDPRNKSLPNPDERRISELRKSREELFTDDHNHVASDVRDYRYDHGKAAPRAYDRLVATAGPPAYDRGQNDEAVSSSSTKHQPRQGKVY